MSVTDVTSAIGDWGLTLKDNTPQEILDKIQYFGHVAISNGHVDPLLVGDALLTSARYVGVVRERNFGEENKGLRGPGMAMWLGDEDQKGELIEAPGITFDQSTFTNAVSTLLPDSLTPGSIASLTGLHSQTYMWQTPRQALDYLCSLYNAEWRVNGDGTVDAGRPEDLYVTTPKAAIIRNRFGPEMNLRALPGRASLDSDTQDFTTRVVMLQNDQETGSKVTGAADILPELNVYRDLKGQLVQFTRVIEETQTDSTNGQARAQLQLNRFTSPRDALKLTTEYYDIRGDIRPGDYVWVYDPAAKLQDLNVEEYFQGELIHPIKLRVHKLTWPIQRGMGVAYRSGLGEWVDLTKWVEWESGTTDVVVGGYNRSLTGAGSSTDPVGSIPVINNTVPRAPEFTTVQSSTYTSDIDGLTRAQLEIHWDQPLNTDDSVIDDGFQYEIRYRTSAQAIYPAEHRDMADYRHNQLLGSHASPIPFTEGAWEMRRVSWDTRVQMFLELTPGIPYDFQIRAYDNASPANVSIWSSTKTVQTRPDTTGPSAPAAAFIASNPAAIQIIHRLGKASGGEFNLESDLNHLRIHIVASPEAECTEQNLVGKIPANQAMMRGEIPAIGTIQVTTVDSFWVKVIAVDNAGNPSTASEAVQSQADLWEDKYISSINVSKILAGVIQSNWLLGAKIATGTQGARIEFAYWGLDVYNMNNQKTLNIDSATGAIMMVGTLVSGISGRRVAVDGATNSIIFYPEVGETRFARLWSYIPSNYPNDIAVELNSIDSDTTDYYARLYLLPDIAGVVVSPSGYGTTAVTELTLGSDSVQVGASSFSVSNGVVTSFIRGRVKISNVEGNIRSTVWNASGAIMGDISLSPDGDIRMTNYAAGSLRGEIIMNPNGRTYIKRNGAQIAEFSENGVYAERFAGPNSRAALAAQGGADVFFYWAGGSLNLGQGGSFIKTFVIDHPTDDDRYLVHGCTESPFPGVEYWGTVEIGHRGLAVVQLPDYFDALTHDEDRVVTLTIIDGPADTHFPRVKATYPHKNEFFIRARDHEHPFRVGWTLHAKRKDVDQFQVEPLKAEVRRQGYGPYTFIEEL